MSTHIVDRIEAIRLSPADTGLTRDVFIVVELGGDNNVRNARTNRRSRDWGATAIGEEWEVIRQACQFAAGCPGGMTRLRGRETKPEAYIRAYRKALATAAAGLVEGRHQKRLSITARIRFTAEQEKDWNFRELVKCRTPKAETLYGEPYKVFSFDLSNRNDLALWIKHCHGPAWNNAEVWGPGTV
jgi:hypothetical protein